MRSFKDFRKNARAEVPGFGIILTMIGVGIALLVSFVLLKPVADSGATATGDTNISSAQASLITLTPTVYIAGLVVLVLVALFVVGIKAGGKHR